MKGKLISRVPEFCKEHDLGPTQLYKAVILDGHKFSYNSAYKLHGGEVVPGKRLQEKLCCTFECQVSQFVLWEPTAE